jgi:hypothetical protein
MVNFFDTLVEVLKADRRFFSEDGVLLRNKVYESAIGIDAGLIGLLLGNAETKKRFFTEVAVEEGGGKPSSSTMLDSDGSLTTENSFLTVTRDSKTVLV